MGNNVYWVLELSIKPGELDNMKALMSEMVAATKADEPNTLNYEWWISEDRKSCHIYERYTDSDGVMVHLGNYGQKFADRFMAVFEPTRFMIYGNVSKEVKDALGTMGAVYMTGLDGFKR